MPENSSAPSEPTKVSDAAEATPPPEPAPAKRSGGKKMWVVVLATVVGLAIVGGVAYLVLSRLGGVTLKTYSNDDFSLLVPADYTVKEDETGVSFEEKGPEDSKSEVAAYHSTFPAKANDEQQMAIIKAFKSQLESSKVDFVDANYEVKNVKVENTTFKGKKALRMTGDAEREGKKVGNLTLMAAITDEGIYMVGVGAHNSDGGLAKKATAIINSFELKK